MNQRIRTVKPEWRTDRKLQQAGLAGRVLSIALITMADDEGRGLWREHVVAADVFGHEEDPSRTLREAVAKLSGWYLRLYQVGDETYFQVVNWHHQKIDKPRRSRLPAPPDGGGPSPGNTPETDDSRNVREGVATDSRNSREGFAPVPGTGDQGSGTVDRRARTREAAPEVRPAPCPKPPAPPLADAQPIERARSLLTSGYAARVEAATGDAWMSADANRQAILDVAKWCASKPKHLDERTADVLDGAFADPWMQGNAYPWGPVAKNPAKYAEAGRKARQLAEKHRRREADEARREAARVASQREAEAGAVPPPAEALRAIGRLVGAIGGVPDTGQRERRERRQRELEAQAAQLRAAGGEP